MVTGPNMLQCPDGSHDYNLNGCPMLSKHLSTDIIQYKLNSAPTIFETVPHPMEYLRISCLDPFDTWTHHKIHHNISTSKHLGASRPWASVKLSSKQWVHASASSQTWGCPQTRWGQAPIQKVPNVSECRVYKYVLVCPCMSLLFDVVFSFEKNATPWNCSPFLHWAPLTCPRARSACWHWVSVRVSSWMPWASMPRARISSDQPQGSTVSTGRLPSRRGRGAVQVL